MATSGNQRYSYCVSDEGHIHTILVHESVLLQPISLVVHPLWMKVKHGINLCFYVAFGDAAIQSTIHFFESEGLT